MPDSRERLLALLRAHDKKQLELCGSLISEQHIVAESLCEKPVEIDLDQFMLLIKYHKKSLKQRLKLMISAVPGEPIQQPEEDEDLDESD